MLIKTNKYESEVHLGMLAIIFLLLCLNFVTNLMVYKARSFSREETLSHLRTALMAVSRTVQEHYPQSLPDSETEKMLVDYDLSSIQVVPSRPPDQSMESRRRWFTSIARDLPDGQLPEFADKLLGNEFNQLTRGEGSEYFFVYPIPAGAGRNLLILSTNNSTLAYLENSSSIILIVNIVALLVVTIIYLVLSRYIFAPLRKIKQHALEAGRSVDGDSGEPNEVVLEYKRIIEELKDNEAKLLRLNRLISNRVDSLERFNDYLLASIDSGIVTLDRDGKIVSINRAAEIIMSVDADQCSKADYRSIFAGSPELADCLTQAVERGALTSYREIDHVGAEGNPLHLGVAVSPIRDHEDAVIGYCLLANDLTELHRLQTELETKHRLAAMGEMAGGLAHQLRNSLGAIAGFGNLIKRRLISKTPARPTVDSLLQEAAEAEGLISQFLDFTRPFRFSPVRTGIREIIEESVGSFQVQDRNTGLRFDVSIERDVNLDLDPLLFKQALSNVIDNAANAYPDRHGTIRICVSVESDTLSLSITDTGCGIEPKDLEQIFTPFFSLNPSGTGLGLPLAGKIMDLHHGRIQTRSEVGRGTTFTLCLPLKSVETQHLDKLNQPV